MKSKWLGLMAAVIALSASSHANANFKNNIIFSSCAAAMRKEYQQANKQLLLSELNKTCNCIVEQINNQNSIERAKSSCINLRRPISSNKSRQSL
tara:strand:+ start:212 stop:496 length:285 start_codon:yes stop_codon:yes gene_type:complete